MLDEPRQIYKAAQLCTPQSVYRRALASVVCSVFCLSIDSVGCLGWGFVYLFRIPFDNGLWGRRLGEVPADGTFSGRQRIKNLPSKQDNSVIRFLN